MTVREGTLPVGSIVERPLPGPADAAAPPWYQEAVVYEVHVRAFKDSDGDGIGDFRGLISSLDYIQDLGVSALWLLPFYPSPLRDDGYDISDYRGVHPSYGTLRDFRLFLREAHRRNLRVITELVLAHTSDTHPWFQRSRQAPPDSVARDYYVWSDTPDRFSDARVIFQDFESSNWSYDPAAKAYYFHRFYAHQPSLNYDSPVVRQEITDVVDFWLAMGVDGLRLDAVPYLYAREGTTCENLPETFEFLRQLRAHVDRSFPERMLLAEANQWPEDAVRYLGDGDVCNMAFHFPLMPRIFMAARQENRYPLVDILAETPAAPPGCQWALFLRNHDELTLEMVTDEERDYMYRTYAQDPQARVNVGIRRRLAPLMSNDRGLIEMMNVLLFSLPGTPILYYGDEIGMGDNIYLGDRDAVRTPMQWDGDRNAGFSRANPQRLYLPVIIDPAYDSRAVNVEAQQASQSSLLWWTRRMLAQRNRYKAFGLGSLELLFPENRKVLAFLRCHGDERILVVVNLSRFPQAAELDLSKFSGAAPLELFGNTRFPAIGDLPYFITLGPHGFYWFSLEGTDNGDRPRSRASLRVRGGWDRAFTGRALLDLEDMMPAFLVRQRWFGGKSARVASVELFEAVPIPSPASGGARTSPGSGAGGLVPLAVVALMGVELSDGTRTTYVLPVSFAAGDRAQDLVRWHPEAVICDLRVAYDGGTRPRATGDEVEHGVLYDAVWEPRFAEVLLDGLARRRQWRGQAGRLAGAPSSALRVLRSALDEEVVPVPLTSDQSNTSIVFGSRLIAKVLRRVEPGTHPGVEMMRHLSERARFGHSPASGGSLEWRPEGRGNEAVTVVTFEEFVANEGDGWGYVVDSLTRDLEAVIALGVDPADVAAGPWADPLSMAHGAAPDEPYASDDAGQAVETLLGPHLSWAALLGERTAEMHAAASEAAGDPAFVPEPLTPQDRVAMAHGVRAAARRALRTVEPLARTSPGVQELLERSGEVLARLDALSLTPVRVNRIRCHGDYHLGQVLWTGKDFVVVDFDGEPARSMAERRRKRPALVDVAGMIRSFHYAANAAAMSLGRSLTATVEMEELKPWLTLWYGGVVRRFLHSYLAVSAGAVHRPESSGLRPLLELLLFEKAFYELDYEANNRPDWVEIPARGVLDVMGQFR